MGVGEPGTSSRRLASGRSLPRFRFGNNQEGVEGRGMSSLDSGFRGG